MKIVIELKGIMGIFMLFNKVAIFMLFNLAEAKGVALPFRLISKLASDPIMSENVIRTSSKAGTLVASVSVGTPPQTFQVLVDTGSSLFYLQSTNCTTQACTSSKALYNQKLSSTFNLAPNLPQNVKYADGSGVDCTVHLDRIALGPNLILPSQQFCMASSVTVGSGTSSGFDGVLGLGAPGNPSKIGDIMSSLSIRNIPMVSFWFNLTNAYPYGTTQGEIMFGTADDSKYSGDFVYFPLSNVTRTKWQISAEVVTYKNGTPAYMFSQGAQAMIDTGTTLVYLPGQGVDKLNLAFGATFSDESGTYTMPCSKSSQLTESLSFFLGGSTTPLTVQASRFFIPMIKQPANARELICQSIIRGSTQVKGLVILGALFLQNFYTVFDYGYERVGFATTIQQDPSSTNSLTGPSVGTFGGPQRPSLPAASQSPNEDSMSKLGIGFIAAGVIVCIAFIALLAYWKFYYRKNQPKSMIVDEKPLPEIPQSSTKEAKVGGGGWPTFWKKTESDAASMVSESTSPATLVDEYYSTSHVLQVPIQQHYSKTPRILPPPIIVKK